VSEEGEEPEKKNRERKERYSPEKRQNVDQLPDMRAANRGFETAAKDWEGRRFGPRTVLRKGKGLFLGDKERTRSDRADETGRN